MNFSPTDEQTRADLSEERGEANRLAAFGRILDANKNHCQDLFH